MDLFLIRHGIAVDRSLCSSDADRPLTAVGKKKTRKLARRFHGLGVRFDVILTSPLVRAYQTAELLQKEGLSHTLTVFDPLAPEGDLRLWVNWYQVHRENAIALVGHQPDLGLWAEQLVWGEAQEKLVVKKAGVIGLKVGDRGSPIGASDLFLLTAPKWFL